MSRTLANYQQLFDVSRRLNTMSSDVASLKSQGDALISGAEWEGKSAARFREFWAEFSRNLTKAEQLLGEGSQEVSSKATLYEAADR